MKFKLGQKVGYRRISRKIEINMQYWTADNFGEDEEKILRRREFVCLDKKRIGYIMGRRRLTFRTIFAVETDSGVEFEPATEWVDIKRQEYGFAYLVAYSMGKTDYVLEKDLKETN
ncbi:MAG: hypothetical protein KAW56_07990 [Candidatus Marinimicrobia bacterium]|nr:hypothetical protein [Candidatus Neomarinimicrobiota bacterium]